MDKNTVLELLKNVTITDKELEIKLGLPASTIGQIRKRNRDLPKKFDTVFANFCSSGYLPLTKIEIKPTTPESFDGSKTNRLKYDEVGQFEKPIDIKEIAHVILKDGIKRQLNKDTVMLLYQLYFPNTGKTEVRSVDIPSAPEKTPQIGSDYENYLSIIEKSTNASEIRKLLSSINDPSIIGYDEYHKLSRIGEQRIKALITTIKETYIQELWNNEDNQEKIMEIHKRIKLDINLTGLEKKALTSNEIFRR